MKLNNIDLDTLSRDEYISLICMILFSFRLNYNCLTYQENEFLKLFIDNMYNVKDLNTKI